MKQRRTPDSAALCAWHACRGCVSPLPAGDLVAARHWVERHVADDASFARLRGALQDVADGSNASALGHEGVVDALAAALAGGRLRVCGATQRREMLRLVPVGAAAPAAAPSPSSAPSAARAAAPPPAESAEPELDAAAMAQTLRDAARDGVPFCEECARAAAASS